MKIGSLLHSSDGDNAVHIDRELRDFPGRDPLRGEPLEIFVRHPTGAAACSSCVNWNLAVERELDKLFERRNADRQDGLCHHFTRQNRSVSSQYNLRLMSRLYCASRQKEGQTRTGRVLRTMGTDEK